MRNLPLFVAASLFSVQSVMAVDLVPTLGKKGKELLSEKFDGKEVPKGWVANTGSMKVQDGALRLSEIAAEKHLGAYRKSLALQNMVVQLDFMFDGAKAFNLGFDPATGELKKKGHLYSISVTNKGWSLIEHNDKANPGSKPIIHAQGALKVETGKWYTLMLENKGEEVVASISGQGTLKAKAADFKVKKPAIVLRASGPDTAGVLVDNVQVCELD
jgi:hypothetical protein